MSLPPNESSAGGRSEIPIIASSAVDPNAERVPRAFEVATSPALPEYTVRSFSTALGTEEDFQASALGQDGSVLGMLIPLAPGDNPLQMFGDRQRPLRRDAPRTLAAVWQNGKLSRFPLPKQWHRAIPGDFNSKGDVVAIGVRYRRGRPPFTSILLYPSGTKNVKDLGTLDPAFANPDTTDPDKMRGVTEGTVQINNRGTILALVGQRALMRRPENGSIVDLGPGVAYDLNEHNIAVGYSSDSLVNAVYWNTDATGNRIAPESLLPSNNSQNNNIPANPNSTMQGISECINENKQIVIAVAANNSTTSSRRLGRTVYYLWDKGKLHYMALMRGGQFGHTHINDAGDVIGFNDFDMETQTLMPCLYRKGKIYDLRNIAQKAGWTIASAIDINNAGQILAVGYQNNAPPQQRRLQSILLTPKA